VGDADDITALRARVAHLEQVQHGLVARLELLDSAVTVTRHGREESLAEVRRLRRAVTSAETNLSTLPLLLASLEQAPTPEGWREAHEAIKLVLDLLEAALRDPIG
jgi:hypothetical protein